jgi:hypothetical protein
MLKKISTFSIMTITVFFLLLAGCRSQSGVQEPAGQSALLQDHPCPNGHISITYDDGPNSLWTPRVLDYLRRGLPLQAQRLAGRVGRVRLEGREPAGLDHRDSATAGAAEGAVTLDACAGRLLGHVRFLPLLLFSVAACG